MGSQDSLTPEYEGFMFFLKGNDDPRRSIGYDAPGNPRFIVFDKAAAKKFAKQDPEIRAGFDLRRIIIRLAPVPEEPEEKKE
jgi:hypothetical protein